MLSRMIACIKGAPAQNQKQAKMILKPGFSTYAAKNCILNRKNAVLSRFFGLSVTFSLSKVHLDYGE